MRHVAITIIALTAGVALGALRPAVATAQLPAFKLAGYESFVVQYTDAAGGIVRITEQNAKRPVYRVNVPPYTVSIWEIPIPGAAGQEVWVGNWRNPQTEAHTMSVFHPVGHVPLGWRVDWVEQVFKIDVNTTTPLGKIRFAQPKVYGPTLTSIEKAKRRMTRYPTFMQTQQQTLEDLVGGDAITMISDDDDAHRKEFGFDVDGTRTGVTMRGRYYPHQGVINPLSLIWVAPYHFQFRTIRQHGLVGALNWYRGQQLTRPTSFLNGRLPAAKKIHPFLPERKFIIACGSTLSPIQVAGKYDMSLQYRESMLNYFPQLHEHRLEFYHLEPFQYPASGPIVFPEAFRTILPGNAALITEAQSRALGIWHVAYTLPAQVHPTSVNYDASATKLKRDGSVVLTQLPNNPATYHESCWYHATTRSVFTTLYVDEIMGRFKFDGAYYDAITAVPFCHAYFTHGHPFDKNEQKIGIDWLYADVRRETQRKHGFRPYQSSETPTDCSPADTSALDLYTVDQTYANLFAATYSGEEWPVSNAVFGWDWINSAPSDPEYAKALANALVGGAVPLVLWPEHTGKMPLDPKNDPRLAVFIKLLEQYVGPWRKFWYPIQTGRMLVPLTSNQIHSPPTRPPQQFVASRDPVMKRWRIPGHRPHPAGGSYPSRLHGNPAPAVLHGVHEPKGQPGVRMIVMMRWTHPSFADDWGLGADDPLRASHVTATLRLSARALYTTPGARIELLDPKTGVRRLLGRLPEDPNAKTDPIEVVFDEVGAKAVVVTPVRSGRAEVPGTAVAVPANAKH